MRRVTSIALLLFSMALGRAGRTADTPAVVVILMPNRAWFVDRESLASAMSAQLSDLQVKLQWETPKSDTDPPPAAEAGNRNHALATFWFAADAGRVFLYGYDGHTGAAQRRPLSATSQQAQIEEASIIVRDNVSARLQGAPLHLGENVPPPPKPASETPRSHASVDVSYVGAQMAPSVWQHGLSVAGLAHLGVHADLGLRALAFLPSQLSPPGLQVRLQRASVRLELGARASFGAPMLRVSGGLFVDRIARSTEATTNDFIASPDMARITFGPFVAAEAGIRLTRGLHAVGGFSLEVPLRTWSYVVVVDGVDAALVPLRVRPGVQVGVKLDL